MNTVVRAVESALAVASLTLVNPVAEIVPTDVVVPPLEKEVELAPVTAPLVEDDEDKGGNVRGGNDLRGTPAP